MSNMRAWTLHGLPEFVAELGGDTRALFRQYRLSARQLQSDDAVLPAATFIRLLETCARELDCRDFGLRLGYRLGPEALGPVALVARHCETAQEAANAIIKYLHIYMPSLRLSMAPLNDDARSLKFELRETRVGQTRQFIEWSMGVSLRHLQMLAGANARPYSIHFSHTALLPNNYYRRFFGCPVYFGQEFISMDLRIADLARPLALNDPQVKQVLADYIEKTSVADDAGLDEQLRATVRNLLPTGRCKLKVIADHYAVSLRTLQRRLNEEGINFNDLVDDVRRELVIVYLQERALPLSQVAALLGYAEQSSLSHACRRWFGAAPNQLKKDGAKKISIPESSLGRKTSRSWKR